MPKGIPLTKEEQSIRCHKIFHKVLSVLVKNRSHETSMREIAESAGIGNSTLYDYFKTGDEILLYFFEDQLNDLTEAAQKIVLQNITADERLRQVLKTRLEILQANKSLFIKLSLEAQRLKLESQKELQKKRHACQDLIRGLIEEGIREAVFRRINPLLAALMLINTLLPVVYASCPTGTTQEMMEETLDIFPSRALKFAINQRPMFGRR